jgi:hypothetical protein
MAFMKSGIGFTGPLGDFSAYKRWDMDEIIIRRKGGASRERIKTSDDFVNTRRNNAEFGARSAMSKYLMYVLHLQKRLADYNIAGPLNALVRNIQVSDPVNDWGKRNVMLSRSPQILAGFSLNDKTLFDSVIRTPLSCSLSKETLTARIELPELQPGINFSPQRSYPMYRILATLGIVPDIVYNEEEKKYRPSHRGDKTTWAPVHQETAWCPVLSEAPASVLELKIPTIPEVSFTAILAVGVCFGKIAGTGSIEQVKHAGAAKVVACG